MRRFVTRLGRFKYTVHNLFAHPAMEVCHLIGFSELGDKIHDATLPWDHGESHSEKEENKT